MTDIAIFLNQKKKISVNIVVNDIKKLPEDEKQSLVEYIYHYSIK